MHPCSYGSSDGWACTRGKWMSIFVKYFEKFPLAASEGVLREVQEAVSVMTEEAVAAFRLDTRYLWLVGLAMCFGSSPRGY